MSQESNQKKAVLITELHNRKAESTCKAFLDLMSVLIVEEREENDVETSLAAIRMRQGRIGAYKQLQEWILRGLPQF